MITGIHALLYSKNADATRAFFRDTLGLAAVDAGQGWGRVTAIELPGGGELGLYEPRHPTALAIAVDEAVAKAQRR